MSIYQEVRSRGVPPSQIILLTAGSFQCDSRNLKVGTQTVSGIDLSRNVFPDYKGGEVTVDTLYRVLTNRGVRKPLGSTKDSNVLIYLTGHGGDGILGFQDSSLKGLSAAVLASILKEMWVGGRYKNVMLMIDSCQSETMIKEIKSPNVLAIASSHKGAPSYSIPRETSMGISEIDQFSLGTAEFLAQHRRKGDDIGSKPRLFDVSDLLGWYQSRAINAVVQGGVDIALCQFFGSLNTIIT